MKQIFWCAGLLSLAMTGCTATLELPPDGCEFVGKTYRDGERIQAPDGCNTCTCSHGQISCTEMACAKSCTVGGKAYPSGATGIPAEDGCNTCSCSNGQVSCTEMACPKSCTVSGKVYPNGATGIPAEDGCNTCSCDNGQLGCTLMFCLETCGGLTGKTCAPGQYCAFPPSTCGKGDQPGTCATKQQSCSREYAPVCGCDGKTYGNSCTAASAGVSIATPGECGTTCMMDGKTYPEGVSVPSSDGCNTCSCSGGSMVCTLMACPPPPPMQCGGLKGIRCGAGFYCDFGVGSCGRGDQTGTCQALPSACDASYSPVCGCDGKTYGNLCAAQLAGVSIVGKGECAPTAVACGGWAGDTCKADQFCDYRPGDLCGAADASATCQPRPSGCPKNIDYVCGCDGRTYANGCLANAAGTGVLYLGQCAPSPSRSCGARAGNTCAKDEYCAYQPGQYCGAADAESVCQPRPLGCPDVWDPVCGCDGKTYSNSCDANQQGVGVNYAGACTTR